jgi:hypothetical protein
VLHVDHHDVMSSDRDVRGKRIGMTPFTTPSRVTSSGSVRRAGTRSGGHVTALGLGLEDLLLHLCFHTSFQHVFRFGGLRSFCDVATTLDERGPSVDWSGPTAFEAGSKLTDSEGWRSR